MAYPWLHGNMQKLEPRSINTLAAAATVGYNVHDRIRHGALFENNLRSTVVPVAPTD